MKCVAVAEGRAAGRGGGMNTNSNGSLIKRDHKVFCKSKKQRGGGRRVAGGKLVEVSRIASNESMNHECRNAIDKNETLDDITTGN